MKRKEEKRKRRGRGKTNKEKGRSKENKENAKDTKKKDKQNTLGAGLITCSHVISFESFVVRMVVLGCPVCSGIPTDLSWFVCVCACYD